MEDLVRIWTTPDMGELLRMEGIPLQVVPPGSIREQFLAGASPGDIAVIDMDRDCVGFLAALKARGFRGPVVFLSDGSTEFREEHYNATVLDIESLGEDRARNLIRFIFSIARERLIPGHHAPSGGISGDGPPPEKPIEDQLGIWEVLNYSFTERLPAVVSFRLKLFEETLTARGVCYIREITEDLVVLGGFSPPEIVKGIVPGLEVYAVFSFGDKAYETVLSVSAVREGEAFVGFPARLVAERRQYIRTEPAKERPLELYMSRAGGPTVRLDPVDISQRGVGFVHDAELPIGETFDMGIVMSGPKAVILCKGAVRFRKAAGDGFRYGAKIRCHPSDEIKVVKYVMNRESDITSAFRRLGG